VSAAQNAHGDLLEPFLAAPERCAVLTDVDGTLAPIVDRPEDASVPREAQVVLERLAHRYRLVACVTGRRAAHARSMVGVDSLVYVGNQGFEILEPGASESQVHPAARGDKDRVGEFVRALDSSQLDELGLRVEDKGPIRVLHWRGAPDEPTAESFAETVADLARRADLVPLWGRKILELRPVSGIDKGSSVHHLLVDNAPLDAAVFAGDDRTDLDAFRAMKRLAGGPRLKQAVCVGVMTDESPGEIADEADIVVSGTEGVLEILGRLAL
jgi:trehalose 6-phosphate phosphatase